MGDTGCEKSKSVLRCYIEPHLDHSVYLTLFCIEWCKQNADQCSSYITGTRASCLLWKEIRFKQLFVRAKAFLKRVFNLEQRNVILNWNYDDFTQHLPSNRTLPQQTNRRYMIEITCINVWLSLLLNRLATVLEQIYQ